MFSSTLEEYVQNVSKVLGKLREAELMANMAKCHWGGTRMEFLGHLVGEGTMSVSQHRVEALAKHHQRRISGLSLGPQGSTGAT